MQTPSDRDIDIAIRQLEINDEREKEAIRHFWARERADEVAHLSLKWRLFFFFCATALFAGLFYWFILAPTLDALVGGR